ncbi:MAG: glycosyltransferase [Candidatus Micrarchaeota archaeon]|nr:glycosyltransferase [Candidatus Micrarchaeota archaeon]
MDYSDTTVVIPVKDEPAVGRVARSVLKTLPNCKAIVIYKDEKDKRYVNFKSKNLRVVAQKGSGKGVACVQAAKLIDTDIMCFIDGDATYDANDLKKLVNLVRHGADLALGSRFNKTYKMEREAMPQFIKFGNRVITIVANMLYNLHLVDSQTGLRAMKKSAFDALGLHQEGFGIETEINVKSKAKGFKIVESPIRYYKRVGESKQVKVLDGFRLLLLDFHFLFNK